MNDADHGPLVKIHIKLVNVNYHLFGYKVFFSKFRPRQFCTTSSEVTFEPIVHKVYKI